MVSTFELFKGLDPSGFRGPRGPDLGVVRKLNDWN